MTMTTSFATSNIDTVSSDLHAHYTSRDEVILDGESPRLYLSRYEVLLPRSNKAEVEHGKIAPRGDPSSICKEDDASDDESIRNLRKRKRKRSDSVFLTISHMVSSNIENVGQQLWRGALLLADYLLYRRETLENMTIVELGSGVGFIGVILSLIPCRYVYLTDMSEQIVALIKKNISTNIHLANAANISHGHQPDIRPRVLDWRSGFDLRRYSDEYEFGSGGWVHQDVVILEQGEKKADVLWLAADVVYDDEITYHLFHTLARMMKPGEYLLLSMEKRFNFETSSLSVVAHGYRRFLRYINEDSHLSIAQANSDDAATLIPANEDRTPYVFEVCMTEDEDAAHQVMFQGKRIPLDFPQAVLNYDRTKDIELWEVSLKWRRN